MLQPPLDCNQHISMRVRLVRASLAFLVGGVSLVSFFFVAGTFIGEATAQTFQGPTQAPPGGNIPVTIWNRYPSESKQTEAKIDIDNSISVGSSTLDLGSAAGGENLLYGVADFAGMHASDNLMLLQTHSSGVYTDRAKLDKNGKLTVSGGILVPDGTLAAPAITFSGGLAGIYRDPTFQGVAIKDQFGSRTAEFYYNGVFSLTGPSAAIFFGAAGTPPNNGDAIIWRDGPANIGIHNTATPQTFGVYGTHTSSTNYEGVHLKYSAASSEFQLQTNKGSVGGLARPLTLGTNGGRNLTIDTSGNVLLTGTLKANGHGAFGANSAIDDGSLLYPGSTFSNILSIQESVTTAAPDYVEGIASYLSLNPSSAPSYGAYGVDSELETAAGNSQPIIGVINAGFFSVSKNGTGTVSAAVGVDAGANNYAPGELTNAYGVITGISNFTGTITNGYSLYIRTPNNDVPSSFTNNYGIYLQDQSGVGATDSYNIYSLGAASKNYFEGSIGIGDTTPAAALTVGANDAFQVDGSGVIKVGALAADPSGSNGLTYYNSTTNKFRCYENGAWADCVGGGSVAPGTINGQTLRWNGSAWTANTTLFNDGTKIGIGTTSPSQQFHIASGAATSYMQLDSNNGTTYIGNDNFGNVSIQSGTAGKDILFYNSAGGTPLMILKSSGYVGLGGSTAPTAPVVVGPNNGYGATIGLVVGPNLPGTTYDRAYQIAPVQTGAASGNSILEYLVPTIASGVTQPSLYGVFVDGKQGVGAVTGYAGLTINYANNNLGATNHANILMGTITIPSGQYGIYDASADPWFQTGGFTSNGSQTFGDAIADATTINGLLRVGLNLADPSGTNGNIYYNSGTNKFRCYENGAWTDCVSAGSGANTALSNLSAVVAVNAPLIPGADNTLDLGSASLRWKTLHVGPGSVVVHNDATNTLKVSLDFFGTTARLVTDAATPLRLTTGANTGINVDTAGKVGIGTASPGSTLEVSGGSYNNTVLLTSADAIGTGLNLKNTASGGHHYAIFASGPSAGIGTGGLGIWDETLGTYRFTINASGNVGVGTPTPNQRLHVYAAAATTYIQIDSNNGTTYIGNDGSGNAALQAGTASKDIIFYNSGAAQLMTVKSGGNVGIGVASPGQKLAVNGNIQTTNSTLGVMLDAADAPLITRGWSLFTSGPFTGAGRTGLFQELNTLVIGVPKVAGQRFRIAGYNADGTRSDWFHVDGNTGNVGVGTTAPGATFTVGADLFQVDGATGTVKLGSLAADPTGTNGLMYYNWPTTRYRCFASSVWTDCSFPIGATNGSTLRYNGTSWIDNTIIYNNGTNVGINTASPSQRLTVNGNISTTNSTLGVLLDAADAPLITRGWSLFTSGPFTGAGRVGLFQELNTLVIGVPKVAGQRFRIAGYNADSTRSDWVSVDANTGYTGIGETAPAALLSVGSGSKFQVDTNGNVSTATGTVRVGTLGSDPAGANGMLYYNNATGKIRCYQAGAWTDCISTSIASGTLSGQTLRWNGSAWVADSNLFNNATNVGIGTTSPTSTLHVVQTGAPAYLTSYHAANGSPYLAAYFNDTYSTTVPVFDFYGTNTGTFLMGTHAANDFQIYTNGYTSPKLTIQAAGNVGVGTTTPSSLFSVGSGNGQFLVNSAGDATAAGDVTVNGGDIISGAATFNLLNSVASTLNIGTGTATINLATAASTTNIGGTGTQASLLKAGGGYGDTGCTTYGLTGNLSCDGDLQIDGGDLNSAWGGGAFNLLNSSNIIGVNFGSYATSINMGSNVATQSFTSAATANLFNTGTTTLNIGGAATTMGIGTSAAVILTVGASGASGSKINLGGGEAGTGNTACTVYGVDGTLVCDGAITTGGNLNATAATFTIANTPTTVNFAGSATALNIGNTAGTNTVSGYLLGNGLTITTQATNTVASAKFAATFTKNDANVRTFPVAQIKPTLNFGASNANTTLNILDIDTTNTSLTGVTTANLINAKYGGTNQFLVASNGDTTAQGRVVGWGGMTAVGDLTVLGDTVATSGAATAYLFNTNASTVNIAGAASLVNIGAATSDVHINDDLIVDGDLQLGGVVRTSWPSLDVVTETFSYSGSFVGWRTTDTGGASIECQSGYEVTGVAAYGCTAANSACATRMWDPVYGDFYYSGWGGTATIRLRCVKIQ